jgi:phosphoserine aminotransferase
MTSNATERHYNFSPGPGVLPVSVLEKIQANLICLPGAGASILEVSHRSKDFIAIQEGAKQALIRLLSIPDDYEVLFMQGGARLQFSMIPLNLLRGSEKPAGYIVTGSWGKYALAEAKKEGATKVVFDAKEGNYNRLPKVDEMKCDDSYAYVHMTSNETIQGVQFLSDPACGSTLVCDSSSDFMCRPVDVAKYGVIYACAQKNAGPAGVTVVIIKKELLSRGADSLPGYLNYKNHAEADSMWNTPPTFAVYALGLVCEWLEKDVGGLNKMLDINGRKAKTLYDVVDAYPEFYIAHAQKDSRSLMNVTFKFTDEAIEKKFLEGAKALHLDSLAGHRSVGGIRASIYNAMPMSGVESLASYMRDFAAKQA